MSKLNDWIHECSNKVPSPIGPVFAGIAQAAQYVGQVLPAHDAEVAAKARAEALEVACAPVCANCFKRLAVKWNSDWKFFHHGESRCACSATAIREFFAARWPEQFGPKEPR